MGWFRFHSSVFKRGKVSTPPTPPPYVNNYYVKPYKDTIAQHKVENRMKDSNFRIEIHMSIGHGSNKVSDRLPSTLKLVPSFLFTEFVKSILY